MPKFKNTPFTLSAKLHYKQFAAVKKYFPHFLNKAKRQHKVQLPDSVTLSKEFVEYLATKDKFYTGVDIEALSTKDDGFKQIYDHLRKKISRFGDEKSATKAPMTNTPKDTTLKLFSPGKTKTAKGEPPAQVKA